MIKQRNIGICILLSIVTCGIYGLYWFVVLTDDINQESGETDATSGGMSLLLTTLHVTSMDGSGHIRWVRKLIS